ncbi:MAG: redoxin domain-containing protein [Clostridiales bacterium]|nr:redoxin domain-containing protein [Clostridiales bacterium]
MPLPAVGEPAPALTLPTHLDTTFSLAAQRGSNTVIAFFPLAFTPV